MATTSPETAQNAAHINRAELGEKTRVHALAKMLGMPSTEMVEVLADNGFEGKRPTSTLPKADVEKVLDALAPAKKSAKKTAKKTVTKAAKKTAAKKTAKKSTAKKSTRKSAATKASEATAAETTAKAAAADTAETTSTAKKQAKKTTKKSAAKKSTKKAVAKKTTKKSVAKKATKRASAAKAVQGEAPATVEEKPAEQTQTANDLPLFQAPVEQQAGGVEQKEDRQDSTQEERKPRRRVRRVVRRFGDAGDTDATAPAADNNAEKSEEQEEKKSSRRRSRRSRGRGKGNQNATEQGNNQGNNQDNAESAKGSKGKKSEDKQAEIEPAQLHPGERDEADIVDEPVRLKGSTRLESRRKWRAENRREPRHIVSRGEFLARRESVERKMVVRDSERTDHPGLTTQVGVVEDGMLVEHFVTSETQQSTVGNVYLGTVQNVLGSMEAAFIDIGTGRNAVLYAGEMNWHSPHLHGRGRRIDQALKAGDQIMVQVIKDAVGHKGARLTGRISFAGRYLVYFPGGTTAGISRKLPEGERKRLKDILGRVIPGEGGAIIRTAAENVDEEHIGADVERLHRIWEGVEKDEVKARNRKDAKPITLYEEPNMLVKVVRDIFNEDFSELIVDGDKSWSMVRDYVSRMAPDLKDRVIKWHAEQNAGQDVFAALELDEQLQKALSRKVWLPSGGHLVIDHTEAMTVIDVNTGSFIGAGGNLEETVTQNNLEAAEEIVRQMRLRDLGGMIVVDFIDMVLEENQDLVLRRLTEYLGRDRTRHKVSEVTSLGLVQMTRKRLGTGLLDTFSTVCEHCGGRGVIVHADPVEHSEEEQQERPRRDHGHRKERQQARRDQRRREEAKENRASAEVAKKVHAASAHADEAADQVEEKEAAAQPSSESSRSEGRRRSRRVRRQAGQRSGRSQEQVHERGDKGREDRAGERRSRKAEAAVEHDSQSADAGMNTGAAADEQGTTVRRTRRVRRVVRRHNTAASENTADRAAARRAESKRRGTDRTDDRAERDTLRGDALENNRDAREDAQQSKKPARGRRTRRVVRKHTTGAQASAAEPKQVRGRRSTRKQQEQDVAPAKAQSDTAAKSQPEQTYEEAKAEFERSPRRKRNTRGNSRSDVAPRPEDFETQGQAASDAPVNAEKKSQNKDSSERPAKRGGRRKVASNKKKDDAPRTETQKDNGDTPTSGGRSRRVRRVVRRTH